MQVAQKIKQKMKLFLASGKNRWILLGGLFLISVCLLIPNIAPAQAFWEYLNPITWLSALLVGLLKLLLLLADDLMQLIIWLLNWAIRNPFGISYTRPGLQAPDNFIIEIGWTLLRDLVNMGFILGLVYIGLATALDFGNKFKTKETFRNLILIALIVNFTPAICGAVVDIGNLLGSFFAQSADFQSIHEIFERASKDLSKDWKDIFTQGTLLLETLLLIIFGFGASLILGIYAILFFVRGPIIWILVILSPVAFFAFIFDQTKKQFELWWNTFIQWALMMPVVLGFFLYLSQQILIRANEIMNMTGGQEISGFFNKILPYTLPLLFLAGGLIIGAGKLMPAGGGAIMGAVNLANKRTRQQWGRVAKGAKRAAKVSATGAKAIAAGYAAAGGAVGGAAIGAAITPGGFGARAKGFGQGFLKGGKGGAKAGWNLRPSSVAGTLRGAMEGAVEGAATGKRWQALKGGLKGGFTREGQEKGKEWIEKGLERTHLVDPGFYERRQQKRWVLDDKAQKRLEGMSSDRIKEAMKRVVLTAHDKKERAAMAAILAERGDFIFKNAAGNIDIDKERKLIQEVMTLGKDLSKLAKSRPDFTPVVKPGKLEKEIKEELDKINAAGIAITPAIRLDVEKWAKQDLIKQQIESMTARDFRINVKESNVLKDKNVIASLDVQKVGEIGARGTIEQRNALKAAVEGTRATNPSLRDLLDLRTDIRARAGDYAARGDTAKENECNDQYTELANVIAAARAL